MIFLISIMQAGWPRLRV